MLDIHPPSAILMSFAVAINNNGQVAGAITDWDGTGFIYSNGQVTWITRPGFTGTDLRSINNSGQVAGMAYPAYVGLDGRAMYYDGSSFHFVDPFPPSFGLATGINNLGHVVGYAADRNGGPIQAFWFDGQASHVIGSIAGTNANTLAWAINDRDEIVGESVVKLTPPAGGDSPHAFYYRAGQMLDLGTLGGVYSLARDINEHGQIVGGATIPTGADHAFLYENGTMLDLNSLLVGDSNLELVEANAINDAGEIVGRAQGPDGSDHGFLLIPIPEPRTVTLGSIAFGGWLAWHIRKQYKRPS